MRRFVVGDIHGGYLALHDLLETVKFDFEKDLLICLGDLVDGWSQSKEVFDLLLRVKNKVILRGNHDEMALYYYTQQTHPRYEDYYSIWLGNGGQSTLDSLGDINTINTAHLHLLQNTVEYYILDNSLLFVHASIPEAAVKKGINGYILLPIDKVDSHDLLWERTLPKEAFINKNNPHFKWGNLYNHIYIGHTSVQKLDETKNSPLTIGNVTLMDTGAGKMGTLSIMNIDTNEVFQSKEVRTYYPYEKGRNNLSYMEAINLP